MCSPCMCASVPAIREMLKEDKPSAPVEGADFYRDWAYRAARHMRNTEGLEGAAWGIRSIDLLLELRSHDPTEYTKVMKNPKTAAD